MFALIVKRLHTYKMKKIMVFFTCVRILTANTICLLRVTFIYALLFQKSTKRWDISYLSCLLHLPYCFRITLREIATDILHADHFLLFLLSLIWEKIVPYRDIFLCFKDMFWRTIMWLFEDNLLLKRKMKTKISNDIFLVY